MLLPGSKSWIKKFFSLEKEGAIVLSVKDRVQLGKPEQTIRNIGSYTGLTYGHCNRTLYEKSFEISRWTDLEVQKVALFESLLEVFKLHNRFFFEPDNFVQCVLDFYGTDIKYQSSFLGLKWVKNIKDPYLQLEDILNQRLIFAEQRFDFKWWKYSMSNALVFLDVILFYQYLKGDKEAINQLRELEFGALSSLTALSKFDGVISNPEKTVLNIYLASSRLDEKVKANIIQSLDDSSDALDFGSFKEKPFNVRSFYLDLMVVMLYSTNQDSEELKSFIKEASQQMALAGDVFESAEAMMQSYLIDSEKKHGVFSNKNSYEKVFVSFGNRWTKILLRNKDKLVVELLESKELIALVSKSTTQELSLEEKRKVKKQFRDIVRSVPALGIFMLPGGAILLPLILKIIPDLIPSAFRDNEINKE